MVRILRTYSDKKRWTAWGGRVISPPRHSSQLSSVLYPMASRLFDECQVLLDAAVSLVLESVSCSEFARA
jgi:hypothetical protein